MKLFYSNGKDTEGKNIVKETETDSLDIWSSKYTIHIRESGIQIKDNRTGQPVILEQEDIIFDTNLDLT